MTYSGIRIEGRSIHKVRVFVDDVDVSLACFEIGVLFTTHSLPVVSLGMLKKKDGRVVSVRSPGARAMRWLYRCVIWLGGHGLPRAWVGKLCDCLGGIQDSFPRHLQPRAETYRITGPARRIDWRS